MKNTGAGVILAQQASCGGCGSAGGVLPVGGFLMPREIFVSEVEGMRVVGKWSGVRRAGNISSNSGILRLRCAYIYRSTHLYQRKEFRSNILVHAEAPEGARVGFHPASMKSVGGGELAPVRHRSSLETPARRLPGKVGLHDGFPIVGVAVGVGASPVLLEVDPEVATGRGIANGAHRDRHDEERF